MKTTRTYRLRPYYRNLAVAGLVGYTSWFVLATFVLFTDVPEANRGAAACLFIGIPLFFTGLSLWMLLAYRWETLTVNEGQLDWSGVITSKRLILSQVTSARWRASPGRGSLVLRTDTGKLTVEFYNYTVDQQKELVRFFRASVPESLQTGWDLFYFQVIKGFARRDAKPGKGEILITRKRYDLWFVPAILLTGCIGVGCWWLTKEARFLVAPLPLVGLWLFVRFQTPRKGMIDKKLSGRPGMLLILAWAAVGIGALLLYSIFDPHLARWMPMFIVGIIVWLTVFFVIISRRRRRELEAAKMAAQQAEFIPAELRDASEEV